MSRLPLCAGLVIRLSPVVSNWCHQVSLPEYLDRHETLGISDIDTRRVDRSFAVRAPKVGPMVGEFLGERDILFFQRLAFLGLANMDLAQVVTTEDSCYGASLALSS